MRPRALAASLLVVLLTAAASSCGGGDSGPHRKLEVIGIEMAFRAPDRVKAGTYDVTYRNEGTVYHELAFNDPSGTTVARRSIAPGTSIDFEVKLEPGTYELACREPGHYEGGMHRTLVVT